MDRGHPVRQLAQPAQPLRKDRRSVFALRARADRMSAIRLDRMSAIRRSSISRYLSTLRRIVDAPRLKDAPVLQRALDDLVTEQGQHAPAHKQRS